MVYVKLTTEDCVHDGYKYKEGLNLLNGIFNNQKIYYDPGGLYFCRKRDIAKWIDYGEKNTYYIWDVVLCNDSKLVDMGDVLKTDKFILENKRTIWDNEEICKLAIKKNYIALKFVKNQTDELCRYAIKLSDGNALKYVTNQTDELCRYAIQLSDGKALKYVTNQTDELCKYAIDNSVCGMQYIFEFVRNQTDELCRYAIDKSDDGYYLNFVKHQSDELCKYAIDKSNGYAINFIKNPTDEMNKYAIDKSNGEALKYIVQTVELCKYAIDKNYYVLKYIKELNDELIKYTIYKYTNK